MPVPLGDIAGALEVPITADLTALYLGLDQAEQAVTQSGGRMAGGIGQFGKAVRIAGAEVSMLLGSQLGPMGQSITTLAGQVVRLNYLFGGLNWAVGIGAAATAVILLRTQLEAAAKEAEETSEKLKAMWKGLVLPPGGEIPSAAWKPGMPLFGKPGEPAPGTSAATIRAQVEAAHDAAEKIADEAAAHAAKERSFSTFLRWAVAPGAYESETQAFSSTYREALKRKAQLEEQFKAAEARELQMREEAYTRGGTVQARTGVEALQMRMATQFGEAGAAPAGAEFFKQQSDAEIAALMAQKEYRLTQIKAARDSFKTAEEYKALAGPLQEDIDALHGILEWRKQLTAAAKSLAEQGRAREAADLLFPLGAKPGQPMYDERQKILETAAGGWQAIEAEAQDRERTAEEEKRVRQAVLTGIPQVPMTPDTIEYMRLRKQLGPEAAEAVAQQRRLVIPNKEQLLAQEAALKAAGGEWLGLEKERPSQFFGVAEFSRAMQSSLLQDPQKQNLKEMQELNRKKIPDQDLIKGWKEAVKEINTGLR